MDNPNITMEEYIRLEEENAQKRRKVFNWETATYGKIWYVEDVHELRSVETEPTSTFNDEVSSEKHFLVNQRVEKLNTYQAKYETFITFFNYPQRLLHVTLRTPTYLL
nr:hypothetical protein [Tanacetum cinerariifolium]